MNYSSVKEWPHTCKGTTCIRMAKLVRWLHRHTEYVMFPSERTQPSLDHTPSFELKRKTIRYYLQRNIQKIYKDTSIQTKKNKHTEQNGQSFYRITAGKDHST